MSKSLVLLMGGALLAASLTPTAAVGVAPGGDDASGGASSSLGVQVAPKGAVGGKSGVPAGPNPYLALVPDASVLDFAGWQTYLKARGAERAAALAQQRSQAALPPPLVVDEQEPDGLNGANDTPATAQPIRQFGTPPKRSGARILGTLTPDVVEFTPVPRSAEDNGSIPLARPTRIGTLHDGIATSGIIGDGPHGSAAGGTGDFDFYLLTAAAGDTVNVDIDTPTGELDSTVAVYNSAGEILALNDDSDGLDSALSVRVPSAGRYYVLVTGFFVLPDDPKDPTSGTGAGSEGPYDVRISLADPDLDFYSVRLRKGDVIGASVAGAATGIAIYDPAPLRENVHGSTQDTTFILPPASPLPGGGNAVTEHVVDQDGWHYVLIEGGSGRYDVTVEAYRPALEAQGGVQTVFLDFDGQRVNTGIWGGPGVRELSPLRSFLGRWRLTNAALNPLIDGIVERVRENVQRDAIARGGNPNFAVRILNSRDHADPFGQPNVSRVIVGGTIAESGIPTIGIAQSIDPGNFETEESALLLLDVLSEPAAPDALASLNTYLRPGSNRIGFIAQGIGNIAAHEVGHYLGSFHVDPTNGVPNVMDAGGTAESFPSLFGVGPDGIGGTADDIDVDFGEDVYSPFEGFTGMEDTLTRTAFGLS